MTRRKQRKATEQNLVDRQTRLAKLLAAGWIANATEVPPDAIPVDPDRVNLGGSWFRPICYQTLEFTCADCGKPQIWQAEDQRWYYETTGAPYYATAKRCRPCRIIERLRKAAARRGAGYTEPEG